MRVSEESEIRMRNDLASPAANNTRSEYHPRVGWSGYSLAVIAPLLSTGAIHRADQPRHVPAGYPRLESMSVVLL